MDQTQLPPDSGQPSGSEDRQPSDALPAASPMQTPTSKEHDDFPENALLEDEAAGWSAQFVVPFQQSARYVEAAGSEAELVTLEGAGHFEPIDPQSAEWTAVRDAIRRLI